MKYSYILFVFILSIICVINSGCERSISSVIRNSDQLPCWNSICPGRTTKKEALKTISNMKEIEKTSIVDRNFGDQNSFISWEFNDVVGDGSSRLYYDANTVTYVRISPENSLILDDIVNKYGNPEKVFAFSDCADSRWLYVALLYPEQGLYTLYYDWNWHQDELPELTPQLPITEVIYYDPIKIEDLITRVEGSNWLEYTYEDILLNLQPWKGFGEITVLRTCN